MYFQLYVDMPRGKCFSMYIKNRSVNFFIMENGDLSYKIIFYSLYEDKLIFKIAKYEFIFGFTEIGAQIQKTLEVKVFSKVLIVS